MGDARVGSPRPKSLGPGGTSPRGWKQVKDWFNSIIDGDIDILETDVIFGNLTDLPHVKECNAIIILGKYFIYGCKLKENIPILPNFLRRIKSELEVEKEIANNLNKIERFLDK